MMMRLINAMVQVESGGNDAAVGDGGKARGCLQITQAALDDYNRYHGFSLPFVLVHDRKTAFRIASWYMSCYGDRFKEKYPDDTRSLEEIYARVWNGGPRGMSKITTIGYWHKVKAEMLRAEKQTPSFTHAH